MRKYEMMVLLQADLTEEALSTQIETIQNWIEAAGGSVEEIDHWGRRRMAYPIENVRDAYYMVYKLNLPTSAPVEIEHSLQIAEPVMRYLITRDDE